MMLSSSRLLVSVILAVTCAWSASALNIRIPSHASTHARSVTKRGVEFEIFHPKSQFKTYGQGRPQPATLFQNLEQDTLSFLARELGVARQNLVYRSGFKAPNGRFGYAQQVHEGVPFANAVANVGWHGSNVVSLGSSFVNPRRIASSSPTIDARAAIDIAEELIGGVTWRSSATLQYLARSDETASLVYAVAVRGRGGDEFVEVYVDAHSGQPISLTNYVADATYRAVPPTEKAFTPENHQLIVDPEDLESSPAGWQTIGNGAVDFNFQGNLEKVTIRNATIGNNVVALFGDTADRTISETRPGVFDFSFDESVEPAIDQRAAVTNAFFILNTMHDVFYRYGFTEDAFNFQGDNFGRGGLGSDPIGALVHPTAAFGKNNAFFVTPPDGESGFCATLLFDLTTPEKDSAMANDVIIHEFAHGLSGRLVGGGTASCIQTLEARGLGEGWSDAIADWFFQLGVGPEQRDFTIGDFLLVPGAENGLRTRPYSTSQATNPLLYADADGATDEHFIGEVWANMLHNIYGKLVAKHGFTEGALREPDDSAGNVVFLRTLVDSLPLLPCNPTLVDARNGWLQADINRNDGQNQCLAWEIFASRGLGLNAENFVNDFTLPEECQGAGDVPEYGATTTTTTTSANTDHDMSTTMGHSMSVSSSAGHGMPTVVSSHDMPMSSSTGHDMPAPTSMGHNMAPVSHSMPASSSTDHGMTPISSQNMPTSSSAGHGMMSATIMHGSPTGSSSSAMPHDSPATVAQMAATTTDTPCTTTPASSSDSIGI